VSLKLVLWQLVVAVVVPVGLVATTAEEQVVVALPMELLKLLLVKN
jgi:hypothetical protein